MAIHPDTLSRAGNCRPIILVFVDALRPGFVPYSALSSRSLCAPLPSLPFLEIQDLSAPSSLAVSPWSPSPSQDCTGDLKPHTKTLTIPSLPEQAWRKFHDVQFTSPLFHPTLMTAAMSIEISGCSALPPPIPRRLTIEMIAPECEVTEGIRYAMAIAIDQRLMGTVLTRMAGSPIPTRQLRWL
jgi:hypothetical protein